MNEILPKEVGRGKPVDISECVARMTLDVICEAAMGQDLGIQENPESEYTRGVHTLARIFGQRAVPLPLRA